jgi:hypothetical protein
VIFPIGSVLPTTAAFREHLDDLRVDGTPAARLGKLPTFDDFTDAVGLGEVKKLERRFG